MRLALLAFVSGAIVLGGCREEDRAPPAPSAEAAAAAATTSQARSQGETGASPSTSAAASASLGPAPPAGQAPPGMVEVPAGVFLMGGESPENTPVHEVVVARFYLDDKEVTMQAYGACVTAGACKPPGVDNPFCNALFSDRGDHPVNCVDWQNADAFCRHVGKRLPTEPEWEYAARGGAEQRPYSWGVEEPDRHRSCYMHEGGSCPVGAHPAGAFGLHDMTGNVWEWTASWYGQFPGEAAAGTTKVYRGGSWSRRFAKWMRNDLRNRYRPDEHSASLGFRCARDGVPLTCPAEAEGRDGRCVRVSGTPLCPKGESFAEGKCRPGGIVPAHDPSQPAAAAGSAVPKTQPAAAVAPEPAASAAPVLGRARAPRYDADCAQHFPGAPIAYSFTGGSFHDREPMVRASGCKKRDVGVGWTSACCAN